MRTKESGLGKAFDDWWAGVAKRYKTKDCETVAKATWVMAWNEGRRFAIAKGTEGTVPTKKER